VIKKDAIGKSDRSSRFMAPTVRAASGTDVASRTLPGVRYPLSKWPNCTS